jgi:hypothetical protein
MLRLPRLFASFRAALAAIALAGSASVTCVFCAEPAAAGDETASRVTVKLEVTGDLFATAAADAEPVRQPVAVEASFDFLERSEPAAGPGGAARTYRTAAATIDSAGRTSRRRLASDAAEVLVALEGTTVVPYLATGFLARDELELLELPFDPLLADGLRPEGTVAPSDRWKIPADLAAGLLTIDTIESGGITAVLEQVVDGEAALRLSGTVVGAVDGVPTRLAVKGTATAGATAAAGGEANADADARQAWRIDGRVTALEVTVSERREAGWVSPGLEVEATLSMVRRPVGEDAAAEHAPAETDRGLAARRADRPQGEGRPGMVWHRHPGGRYAVVLDGRWRVVEDGPEGLVMRLVDRGALVAQCSILPLPRINADSPPTEETVCSDVRRSLADQFGHLAESAADTRDDGTRVVRVVADGSADGRPFRWIHHVVTGSGGHQVAVTFMLEPAVADRFAAADRQLVEGLIVLPDPPDRSAAAPDGERR